MLIYYTLTFPMMYGCPLGHSATNINTAYKRNNTLLNYILLQKTKLHQVNH